MIRNVICIIALCLCINTKLNCCCIWWQLFCCNNSFSEREMLPSTILTEMVVKSAVHSVRKAELHTEDIDRCTVLLCKFSMWNQGVKQTTVKLQEKSKLLILGNSSIPYTSVQEHCMALFHMETLQHSFDFPVKLLPCQNLSQQLCSPQFATALSQGL